MCHKKRLNKERKKSKDPVCRLFLHLYTQPKKNECIIIQGLAQENEYPTSPIPSPLSKSRGKG